MVDLITPVQDWLRTLPDHEIIRMLETGSDDCRADHREIIIGAQTYRYPRIWVSQERQRRQGERL